MGVKRILLVETARVEKSYWRSSVMRPESLRRHLMLGLAQARDTVLPEIECLSGRRDLIERLPRVVSRPRPASWLLTPPAPRRAHRASLGPTVLLVGPEGGLLAGGTRRVRCRRQRERSAWGHWLSALSMRWSHCWRGSRVEPVVTKAVPALRPACCFRRPAAAAGQKTRAPSGRLGEPLLPQSGADRPLDLTQGSAGAASSRRGRAGCGSARET